MVEFVELMIKQPGHQDRVVRLVEGASRMGRAEDNEVVLSDVGVSRRHAQVFVSRSEVTVEDLGSGNGTYYNGYRLQSQAIQDGDEIVIDPFVLKFRVRGATAQSGTNAPGRPPTQTAAKLEVVVGKGMAGSTYPITSRGLSIGRSEDRDVVIPDPAASRHHAQITAQGNDYVLRDMGASNGIFVNAVRVRECTLADGDMVRIGNTEMKFVRYEEGAPPSAPPRPPEPAPPAGPPKSARPPEPSWDPGPRPGASVGRPEPLPVVSRSPSASAPPARVRSVDVPRPRRSRTRPVLAMVFGTFLVFGLLLAFLVVVVIAIVAFLKFQPVGLADIPPEPPGWVLKEPPGLLPATVPTLFEAGREKINGHDRRGALLDFYRALKADPTYPYVDKFAFAAGEFLVMDELQKEFSAKALEKRDRLARRDRLLADLSNSNSKRASQSEATLRKEFGDDPVVVERLELPQPEALVALEKLQSEANEKVAVGKYDEAVLLYQKVLREAEDPTLRTASLAGMRLAQKEVARASQQLWIDAVSVSRTDRVASTARFGELQQAHPANPSAPAHLSRWK